MYIFIDIYICAYVYKHTYTCICTYTYSKKIPETLQMVPAAKALVCVRVCVFACDVGCESNSQHQYRVAKTHRMP